MQETIQIPNVEEERALLGREDRHLRLLRKALGLSIVARNGRVQLEGDEETLRKGARLVHLLLERVREQGDLSEDEVHRTLREAGVTTRIVRALDDTSIRPRTHGQAAYVRAVEEHDIVFAIGPAGTGKTYLAVALAIGMMKRGLYRKLVLVRPAVEAGEKLGFLPGSMAEKVSPYLRPLYDAIGDILPFAEVTRYMERDVIEVAPLAFMRGRTLDHAFVILDEAQNTTPKQMKMFLTRMGRRSKIVVTGDITQTDLPRGGQSGLRDAHAKLKDIDGISFVELTRADIVRHPLVQKIVEAYDDEPDAPTADDAHAE